MCPSELLLRCQLLNRSSCRASAQTCRSAAGHSPAVVPPSVERSQQTPLWSSADRDASGNPSPPRAGQQVEKVGVLLLNLGGPETLDDVQPFLYNLFNDDSIIRLPAQGESSLACESQLRSSTSRIKHLLSQPKFKPDLSGTDCAPVPSNFLP